MALLLRFGWMARWGTDGEFTSLPWPLFLEGMGVVVLLMAAGNWINAYFDVVEDRINRPDRAIVDRTVKRRVLIVATGDQPHRPGARGTPVSRIGKLDPAADGPRRGFPALDVQRPLESHPAGLETGSLPDSSDWSPCGSASWSRHSTPAPRQSRPCGWACWHTGAWHPASPWSGKSPRMPRTSKATSRLAKPPFPPVSAPNPPLGPPRPAAGHRLGLRYGPVDHGSGIRAHLPPDLVHSGSGMVVVPHAVDGVRNAVGPGLQGDPVDAASRQPPVPVDRRVLTRLKPISPCL